MKKYLKLIRVKHWLKNILIFLPLFFSQKILNTELLIKCIVGFFIFSFTSCTVYVINDLNDIEKDRLHPIKKKRTLATGAIPKEKAYILIIILLMFTIIQMLLLWKNDNNAFIFIIPCIYLIINILYSKGLKDIQIIDVGIIVVGFILRVVYGGLLTNVEVSKYLYLMIIFGSFYLGFGKRRNEIINNGDKSRKVLEIYNKVFLDKNMYVALSLGIVSYTLWCVDPTTISRIDNDYIFWTIPLLMIILQLYSLNIEGNSSGDPIEVIFADKKLLISTIIYVLVMAMLLYLKRKRERLWKKIQYCT